MLCSVAVVIVAASLISLIQIKSIYEVFMQCGKDEINNVVAIATASKAHRQHVKKSKVGASRRLKMGSAISYHVVVGDSLKKKKEFAFWRE